MQLSRAAVLSGPGQIAVQEFSKPETTRGTGLLRVEVAGVCTGTDVKLYRGKLTNPYPIIPGHEIVGIVEEIGDGLSEATGVGVGDRVVVMTKDVGYGLRRSTDVPPGLWGGYAEHMYLAPGTPLLRVPPGLSGEQALMATVFANGLHWSLELGGVRLGHCVVVQGVGQQGLASIAACHQAGAWPVIAVGIERDGMRLDLAREFGADHVLMADQDDVLQEVAAITSGAMADVVVELTGVGSSFVQALRVVRRGGTVVYGSLTGSEHETLVPLDDLVWKQIRVQGVYSKDSAALGKALAFLATGRLQLERMITHRLPLGRAREALEIAEGGGDALKVVILPEMP